MRCLPFRSVSLLLLLCLCGLTCAAPNGQRPDGPYIVHEKRDYAPGGWVKRSRVPASFRVPVRIALKQSGIEALDAHLMRVADPDSPAFGQVSEKGARGSASMIDDAQHPNPPLACQHWDPARVASTFAPSHDSLRAVTDWLAASGISLNRLSQSTSRGWLNFDASAVEAEQLLKTDFFVYEHAPSGELTVGTEQYSLPQHVQPHIDFVTPTLHFVRNFDKRDQPEANTPDATARIANNPGSPSKGSLPKEQSLSDPFQVINDLKNCSKSIVPICLRALYGIPPLLGPQVSQDPLGVLEFTPQSYVQKDLDTFFHDYAPELQGRRPELISIDGGYVNDTATNFTINGESNLDLQYAMTISQLSTKLYQVGDAVAGASFSDFLDALDGSFCQFDDPDQDAMYPDNSTSPNAYKGPKQCGGIAASKVISVSYGQDERDITAKYATRQCQEYAKLGLMGTTFVFSSGDYGVAGNGDKCGKGGRFSPEFPASCPYVLAVGATQVKNNTSVIGTSDPEEACETVIRSGGGFSDVFARPSYQDEAVSAYLAANPSTYSAAQFNSSGSRAIPDVSANGAHYHVNLGGQYKSVYGTSASAPLWAALISRFNEARARIGKGPIGFINPSLYKYNKLAPIFKDITSGNNPGCNTTGFAAVQGYDPVTGLGTPNFEALNAVFLALP